MSLCEMPVLVLLDLFLRSLNLLPTSRNGRHRWTCLPIKLGHYRVAFSLVNSDVNRVSWMSLCVQWLCSCINITHSRHGSLLVVLVINKCWLMFEFVIQGVASPSLYYFTLNVSVSTMKFLNLCIPTLWFHVSDQYLYYIVMRPDCFHLRNQVLYMTQQRNLCGQWHRAALAQRKNRSYFPTA